MKKSYEELMKELKSLLLDFNLLYFKADMGSMHVDIDFSDKEKNTFSTLEVKLIKDFCSDFKHYHFDQFSERLFSTMAVMLAYGDIDIVDNTFVGTFDDYRLLIEKSLNGVLYSFKKKDTFLSKGSYYVVSDGVIVERESNHKNVVDDILFEENMQHAFKVNNEGNCTLNYDYNLTRALDPSTNEVVLLPLMSANIATSSVSCVVDGCYVLKRVSENNSYDSSKIIHYYIGESLEKSANLFDDIDFIEVDEHTYHRCFHHTDEIPDVLHPKKRVLK